MAAEVNIPACEVRDVTMDFPGVRALDGVSLDLRAGEIHALVGENGAGKSTLIRILSGVHAEGSFRGYMKIGGRPAGLKSVRDAERAGIATIHQELRLVPSLTVAENIWLGDEPAQFGFVRSVRAIAGAQRILDAWGLRLDARVPVSDLSIAEQQMTEIARALRKECRIFILDEPTSALADGEVRRLFDILRSFRNRGVAVLTVSHRLEEVFAIADRISVLRDGKLVASANTAAWTRESVVKAMVGRDVGEMYPVSGSPGTDPVLRVQNLTVEDPQRRGVYWLKDVSFELKSGEILGFAGLVGAGRSEVLRTIFGEPTGIVRSGRIDVAGRTGTFASASEAVQKGIAMVPEDRKQSGLVLPLSVSENLTLTRLSSFVRGGILSILRMRVESARCAERSGIRAATLDQPVETLSGGNQQKVVIGKWLFGETNILLLDEPTRGIDVGAKVEIYRLVSDLRARGVSIIVSSSELPELLGLCDRIVVLRRGTVSGECTRMNATQEKIMELAA